MGVAFCYVYVYTFFQTWFHTFLVKGRGFSAGGLALSALPYAIAACANLGGGAASDALVRRFGARRGRRAIGTVALGSAGLFTLAAMFTQHQLLTVILLSLVYGCITFQQSGVFGVCLDIGRKQEGSVVGLMNTSAPVGGLLGSTKTKSPAIVVTSHDNRLGNTGKSTGFLPFRGDPRLLPPRRKWVSRSTSRAPMAAPLPSTKRAAELDDEENARFLGDPNLREQVERSSARRGRPESVRRNPFCRWSRRDVGAFLRIPTFSASLLESTNKAASSRLFATGPRRSST